MCGIVGVIGDLWQREETLMKRLLLIDWIRGPDSTGMAGIRLNGDVRIAKVADHPLVLFDTGRFKDALNGNMSKAFIGHNRLATRGGINHGNTHPFEVGDIVGCHNGTLDYDSFSTLKKELGEEFTVDSHALIAAINKWGLKDAMSRIEGSYSVVWYDKRDGSLNMLRNAERPMTYAYTKDFKKVFFASEAAIIDSAVKLTGSYELYEDDKGFSFFKTEENYHYRWVVEDVKKGSATIPKPKVKKIEGKKKETRQGSNQGNFPSRSHSGTPSRGTSTGTGSTSNGPILRSTGSNTGGYNGGRDGVHQCVGHRHRPFGAFLSREDFEFIAAVGCQWCESPVEWGECGITVYEKEGILLCPDCTGGKSKRRNRIVIKNRVPLAA